MKLKLTSILLAAGVLVGCNETREDNVDSAAEVREIADADTAVMYDESNVMSGTLEADEEEFKEVDFGAPTISEPNLERTGVEVRGTGNYRIYSVGEDIMFDLDKAKIRPSGEEKLKEIANNIKSRDQVGKIRVYGFTDSLASKEYNRELARERAKNVEDWLMNNSQIDTSKMKIVSMGERMPEATNATAQGRQQNRRVEIVVMEQQ
ncbi:OmpA family protein [Pontibacter actiniarum]|nr:OmpA family protein [Pontibacter actiniarum]